MSTCTCEKKERVDELLARLAKIEGHRTGVWAIVAEKARRYAVMKATGTYVEVNSNGHERIIRSPNPAAYANSFAQDLLRAAEDALTEELAGPYEPPKTGG